MLPADRRVAGRLADAITAIRNRDRYRCHRKDVNSFIEYAMEDDDKQPVRQAQHHTHLQYLITKHDRVVVLYPVGHGKTSQVIFRIIWELGNDPSLRIVVISSKLVQSKKVVSAVAREIVANERIREVFPDLKPARGQIRDSVENWSGSALRVEGSPAGQKDPSLAAYGLDGSISGTRADIIFCDNACDFENTSSRHQRNKTVQRFSKEAMTRLVPSGGRVVITDTAWSRDDLSHAFMKRPGWSSVVFSADVNPNGDGPLWPERFSREYLDKTRGEIGSVAYGLTYQNKPMSDTMAIFKEAHCRAAVGKCEWLEEYHGPNPIVTGVDLAVQAGQEHDLTVFTTCEDLGTVWKVRNILALRCHAGDILRHLVDIAKRFHFNCPIGSFVVENNAAQDYIVQMGQDAEALSGFGIGPSEFSRINVTGRTTTANNKRDLELGIPRIAADLEMGRWELPEHPEVESLVMEMLEWVPDLGHHTGDRLISLWQARSKLEKALPKVVVL